MVSFIVNECSLIIPTPFGSTPADLQTKPEEYARRVVKRTLDYNVAAYLWEGTFSWKIWFFHTFGFQTIFVSAMLYVEPSTEIFMDRTTEL